jgi:NADPH-dependent glutamate synthase beta subunit-like oxidoreductase/Pyruvate/2-oxoacid:ferredoxin oxidoreductase delta subunit
MSLSDISPQHVEGGMGYRVDIDHDGCINCGICMDVCPVEALDMSRPDRAGVEGGRPILSLMEHPVQVGECIGCDICARECPVHVITIETMSAPTPLAPRQGPLTRAEPAAQSGGWIPLSEVTREVLKPTHVSPWGTAWRSAPAHRSGADRAPCQVACPAGTDAGRYVGLIRSGRFDDAFAVAAEVNPFPSVCGWICTAPCEAACRRGTLDEPIAIRTLKRAAAEHGTLPPIEPPAERRSAKVAIVGGGPAGMSAAYYLARLGYPVTVYEAMPVPGGMMAIGIPEYRLPREVLRAEIDRILALGVELKLDHAMGRDMTLADLETAGFRAIFLATGASKSRRLDVPGDDLRGVVPATLFLKQVNLGEAPRLTGPVVVVGGGSTAMDAARSAIRSGAERVTVVYRRARAEMPAQAEEVEAAEREGIEIVEAVAPVAVLSERGLVTGLRGIRQRVAERPDGGRATYEPVPDGSLHIPASTILVAIGEEPDPSILPDGAGIEISGWAGIVADPRTFATGRPGVFAGGDVVSGPKTIIDAVAAGRRVAGSIHEYLADVADGEAEILRTVRYRTEREETLELDLAVRPRAHAPLPVVALETFRAGQQGFDVETAQAEAARCFRCDAIAGAPTVSVTAGRGPADRPMNDGAPIGAPTGPATNPNARAGASMQGGGR